MEEVGGFVEILLKAWVAGDACFLINYLPSLYLPFYLLLPQPLSPPPPLLAKVQQQGGICLNVPCIDECTSLFGVC